MSWEITPYLIPILIAAVIAIFTIALTLYRWQPRSAPGAIFIAILVGAVAWWLLAYAVEISTATLDGKLFWAQVQYFGIVIIPVAWFLFTLDYTGRGNWITWRNSILLFIFPILTLLLVWTNQVHRLIWTQAELDERGIVYQLALSYGAWFWLHVLFSYALLFAGAVLLIRAMKSRPYQHRGQMITLLVGLAIAWIGNLLYLVDLNPVAPLDISLFTLVISSLVIAWGLIRYPPTAGIPIARHNLVDKMKDGVIVLDLQNRVIDMNRTAQVILECTSQSAVGLPIQSLWKLWPRDITFPLSEVEIVRELIQEIDGEYRTLELRITTLMERPEGYTGRLVVIHDNTPRKRAEESLLRREMILEAISFEAELLLSGVSWEDSLPQVLRQLGVATGANHVYIDQNDSAEATSWKITRRIEWHDEHEQRRMNEKTSVPLDGSNFTRWLEVLSRGRAVYGLASEFPESERLQLAGAGIHSMAVVPIFAGEAWWGLLGFEVYDSEREWSPVEIDALRTAASTMGAAIQREQTNITLQRRAEVISTLLDVSETIGSTLDIKQVLDQIVNAVHSLISADRIAVFTWDEEGGVFVPALPREGSWTRLPLTPDLIEQFASLRLSPDEIPLIREIQNTKQALCIEDAGSSPLFPSNYAQEYGVKSLFVVPLVVGNRIVGGLYTDYIHERHSFTSEEIELATALARQAALALERARLYAQSQQDARELSALYRASSQLLNPEKDLLALAKEITRLVTSEFASAYCSLFLVDRDHNRLELLAEVGSQDTVPVFLPLDGAGLTVYAASIGEVVYAPDVSQEPRYIMTMPQTRSELDFPLRVGDQIIGVLNMESPRLNGFDARARRILAAFAYDAALALQNILLFRAASLHARQMAMLNEITSTAIGTASFQEMLESLADQMNSLMEADDCFIVLWDEDHGRLLPGSASQRVRERAGSFRFDQDADALTRVVLSVNIPLAIEDFRQSPYVCPSLVDLFEAQSVLGISLNANERRYGVLVISFAKPHHFSERQIYLYEQAAGLVALTIAKAWSLETARQRADEAETLRQAGAVVAATLQQDEAIQRILEQLMRVVPYDSASVQLLGNGYLEIVGGLGWRDQSSVLGLRFPIPGDNPNTRVVQTRKPYILGDALLHHKTFGQAPHNHIHSWMGVPLIVHDQVIGMLAIDNMQVNYFTEDQARLVSAFADQVAIVMENARLYKAARQAAERRAVLYRISQEIVAASFDPERIYAAIHRATEHLMPAEAFAITLYDESAHEINAVYLFDKAGRAPNIRAPANQGLSGYIFTVGKSIIIDDSQKVTDIEFLYAGDPEHTRSILAVPLRLGEKIIGVLSTQSYKPQMYTAEDQELLEMLAAHAAIALENARLFREVEWMAITDPLTGLYNPRGLNELGRREIDRARRFNRPLSAIFLDLDDFKEVNDTYGHVNGDQVLISLANACRQNIREVDIIGRMGGDEFVVLLPETELKSACQVAERLRRFTEQMRITTEIAQIQVTASLGVGLYTEEMKDLATLIDQADMAMYAAKQAGKNRVMDCHAVQGN